MIEDNIVQTLIYLFAWWGLLSFVGSVVIISFLLLMARNQKRKSKHKDNLKWTSDDGINFKATYDDD